MATNNPMIMLKIFMVKGLYNRAIVKVPVFSFFEDFDDSEDEYHINSDDLTSSDYSEESSDDDNDAASPVRAGNQASAASVPPQWTSDYTAKRRFSFDVMHVGLHEKIIHDNEGLIEPIEIFNQFFDDNIIEMMVCETNRYSQQYMEEKQLRRHSRMKKWKDTTKEEMKTFIGVIMMTGLVKYPRMELYWSKDPLYYHPIFHYIGMSYNRFNVLLKNWHVANNKDVPANDRLHKISKFTKQLISNIKKVYTPAAEISVDETQIGHRGRFSFRQYNPGKEHKYRIKMFKLADMSGDVWDFSIDCGKRKDSLVDGLDHSGSVVVTLAESTGSTFGS